MLSVPDVEVKLPELMVIFPAVHVPLPKFNIAAPALVKSPPAIPLAPKVILPVVPMLPAATIVIAPLKFMAVDELLVKEPSPEIPVPLIVSDSAVPRVNPFRSRAASSVTEVPAAIVPNGVFVPPPPAPSLSVP